MADENGESAPSAAILPVVYGIRHGIPGWRRSLASVVTEASRPTPEFQKIQDLLAVEGSGPNESATELQNIATAAGSTLHEALDTHADLLRGRLVEAGSWWARSLDAAKNSNGGGVLSNVDQAQASLDAAMQHALFITYIDDVRNGHVGESRSIDTYGSGWGVNATEIDTLWSWLREDPRRFDGNDLPVVLDTVNRAAYRKTRNWFFFPATVLTSVWMAAFVYGVVALLFAILHSAGLTSWPVKWGWKLLVLLLFVAIGALAHVGARALNINYDDPMKVYDAGNILDWLSLRWLAIMRLYIPVAVVVAILWGAGNIPASFQALATAILAGYTADSFMGSALSRLQGQAAKK